MDDNKRFTDADALWEEYATSRCQCHRDQLIVLYMPVVRRVAAKIWRRTPNHVELEDLISYGTFGLIKAVEVFRPGTGVKFENPAAKYIRGAILDELRKVDWAPRSVRRRQRELDIVARRLEEKLGREPTIEEMAIALEITVEEVLDRQDDHYRAHTYSLDSDPTENVSKSPGQHREIMDPESPVTLDDLATSSVIYDRAERALRGMSYRHQLVVTLYYFEGLSLVEAARVMGLAEYRVARLHNEAMLLIREEILGLLDHAAA